LLLFFGFLVLIPLLALMEGELEFGELMLWTALVAGFAVVVSPLVAMAAYIDVGRTMTIERNKMRQAVRRYGAKWLSIHSENDEAINALRAGLSVRWQSLFGSWKSERKPFPEPAEDQLNGNDSKFYAVFRVDRLTFWPFRKLMAALSPLVNRFVALRLTALALGGDRLGATALTVGTTPIPELSELEPLSTAAEDRLQSKADKSLAHSAPLIRELFTDWGTKHAVVEVEKNVTELLGDSVLIHTSYFADEEIVDLIALHICPDGEFARLGHASRSALSWYANFLQRRDASLVAFCRQLDQRRLPGQTVTRKDQFVAVLILSGLVAIGLLLTLDPLNLF
jgi:hypothetical protein